MSVNAELLAITGKYMSNEISFADLVAWTQDREEHWAMLPQQSLVRVLADAIMLAAFEVDEGTRPQDSVRELLAQATLQPAH